MQLGRNTFVTIKQNLLWAFFYFPAACAVAGYTRNFGSTLNPRVGIDTIKRKYRKLFGFGLSNKGYLDTTDYSIMGNKLAILKKLINQPKYEQLGIDTTVDKLEDLSANQLISMYEEMYGPILLSQCDMFTSFSEKYECSKPDENAKELLVKKARNENLTKAIKKESAIKIGIIYGSDHIEEIIKILKNPDNHNGK